MKLFSRFRRDAFTLVELLVVITIIITLAGISVGIFNGAQARANRDRARAEIAAMEAALDAYRADYGGYPPFSVTSGSKPPEDYFNPTTTGSTNTYQGVGTNLYQTLCVLSTNSTKMYLEPKQNQLGGIAAGGGRTNFFLKDPWGNAYGYSASADVFANPNAGGTNLKRAMGVSIWSTAGNITATATNKWITNYDPARP